ncbi:MAG: N-acetyltransferase [Actinomycetia bacterium]|nr:N-acetyltransferase [Actinomycetes bacterium]
MTTFIHPTAVIDAGAEIGEGSKIWHFCHVMSGARLGRNVVLGQNCFVASGVSIGDGCRIQNNVSLYSGVTLEENVFCGPSAVFTNVSTPRAAVNRHNGFERTLVRRGASLGANCTIVCGSTIGDYALVGAGAVVCQDVPAHRLAVGVPTRPAGWVCRCGEVLPLPTQPEARATAGCRRCGETYWFSPATGLNPRQP